MRTTWRHIFIKLSIRFTFVYTFLKVFPKQLHLLKKNSSFTFNHGLNLAPTMISRSENLLENKVVLEYFSIYYKKNWQSAANQDTTMILVFYMWKISLVRDSEK